MPEFKIYPSNLRRHKKQTKKIQTNKSNRAKFTYVRVKTWFSRLCYYRRKISKKPWIRLKRQTDQETLWKFPLCVISHVDQQSSRIGRKMSHVYCIVRTQDSYVLSRGQAIWKSVAKNLDFFWLLIAWGWRSANAVRAIGVNKRTEDMCPACINLLL